MSSVLVPLPSDLQETIATPAPPARRKKNGWKVADHPPCSPDLNPIEHVWQYLKAILHQKSHLSTCLGGPAAVKKRLADYLLEAWKDIPSTLLDSLTKSMPRRVAAVIKAEGWYTKY